MKAIVKGLLAKLGLSLIQTYRFRTLKTFERIVGAEHYRHLLLELPAEKIAFAAPYIPYSKSQLGQDLFVLAELGGKKNGYFVEFGATDGVTLSNSWVLENHLGWQGILCEPAKGWHSRLIANRQCKIDKRCVWSTTGETLSFSETPIAELSGICGKGYAVDNRDVIETYEVETVSLTTLLTQHNAPPLIDYLSIDTEGSEYEILAAHDFDRYKFRTITAEHNGKPARASIYNLLTRHGYQRKYEFSSFCDDWYVLKD